MIWLRIDPKFTGVTLTEMESLLLVGKKETVVVRWENTRREIELLRRYQAEQRFVLMVPDIVAAERAAATVGTYAPYEVRDVLEAFKAVVSDNSQWRNYVMRMGPNPSRALVMRYLHNALAVGQDDSSLRSAVTESLLDGIAPVDIDILCRLRQRGARR